MEPSDTIKEMQKKWNALSDEEKRQHQIQREKRNRQIKRNEKKKYWMGCLVFIFGPIFLSGGLVGLLFIGSHVTEGAFTVLSFLVLLGIWYAQYKLGFREWFNKYCERF